MKRIVDKSALEIKSRMLALGMTNRDLIPLLEMNGITAVCDAKISAAINHPTYDYLIECKKAIIKIIDEIEKDEKNAERKRLSRNNSKTIGKV